MLDFSAISNSGPFGKLLRLPLRLIPPAATVRVLQGPLRGRRWIVGSGVHGFWLGSYEREKCALFAQLIESGAVVFDVGANVGYYTLLAATTVAPDGRVYAFEPVPRNAAFLARHLAINGIRNTTVLQVAVAAQSGEATFDPGGDPSLGHFAASGTLRVSTVVLDELLAKGSVEPPTLMKIDVEGAELAVLQGASHILRTHRPVILLATHNPAVHRGCMEFLRALGYELTPLDAANVNEASELLARPTQRPRKQ